ncbi:MAG: hypothetical protein GY865_13575 [candidate division Zixibacteria bacterium]|nr:hypothetical protein [candidate division Zixibacteria bacterium]
MKYKIAYNSDKKYITADIVGDIELEPLKQFISDTADFLKKHNCQRIIHDLRSASVNMTIIEIDEVPQLAMQFGIDPSLKRALVISDDFKKYNFFESASRSKRQNVKIFKNYAEAEKWILSDETSASQEIHISLSQEDE